MLLYCAVGFQNKKVFVANAARGSTVGVRGSLGYTPHLVLSCTLVVHTFSGFRIASRGTSTVSEC